MEKDLAGRVLDEFTLQYKHTKPLLVCSPGRINLIGEHTDYNDGFVLPAAVSQGIYLAIAPSSDENIRLTALDMDDSYTVDLADIKPIRPNSWPNYLLGVVAELKKIGASFGGFQVVFAGDIPVGSGMSSSAALENAVSFGLNEIFDLGLTRKELLHISQKAEHNYAGVKCGIMDQFSSMMGKDHHALLLDCRSLDFEYYAFDLKEYTFVLINSNVTHDLATSAYNERRSQCEAGVHILSEHFEGITALRDATHEQLDSVKNQLDPIVYRRCKYVIEENLRVKSMTQALAFGNLEEAGRILRQAQKGMADEYEISCPEIDFLADFANNYPGVLGARMMGGGFGGCTINLVKKDMLDDLFTALRKGYKEKFGLDATLIPIEISDGTHVVS